MAGVNCLWRAADYWREQHGLPEALPAELAEQLRPARHKAMQRVPSVQAAAAAAAGSDEEGGGRDEEAEEEYNPEEEEEEEIRGGGEAPSDFDSDDGGCGPHWPDASAGRASAARMRHWTFGARAGLHMRSAQAARLCSGVQEGACTPPTALPLRVCRCRVSAKPARR